MNVGVIGDGATDYRILLKIVECVIPWYVNEYELRGQSFRDAVDRYWSDSGRTNDCWFPQEAATTLSDAVLRILYTAFSEFQSLANNLTDHDILIVNTDTERHLENSDFYFNHWAFSLTKIFISRIERFCHEMIRRGYRKESLPLVIPILPFPSTDILIAVARGITGCYGTDARTLKNTLYGTTNLDTIQDDDFEELALEHITPDGIRLIFQRIPESRLFINFLSAIGRNGHSGNENSHR